MLLIDRTYFSTKLFFVTRKYSSKQKKLLKESGTDRPVESFLQIVSNADASKLMEMRKMIKEET